MATSVTIDVSTFQKPLAELATTMALKVECEATALMGAPGYVAIDIGVLLRISNETPNLLWYLNADEKRNEPGFRAANSGPPVIV